MFDFFKVFRKIESTSLISIKRIAEILSDYEIDLSDNNKTKNTFLSFLNEVDEDLKTTCWNSIFKRTGINKLLTDKTRQEIEKLKKEQQGIDFTENNIHNLLNILFQNQNKILESCVLDVFDYLTKYHDENRVHFEGWKTNDSWKVNKKFILPNIVNFYSYGYWTTGYSSNTEDIDRCMCFLSG
jgi:hypothetical protein